MLFDVKKADLRLRLMPPVRKRPPSMRMQANWIMISVPGNLHIYSALQLHTIIASVIISICRGWKEAAMGDKGGKKDKEKSLKQKETKHEHEIQQKKDKQPKSALK